MEIRPIDFCIFVASHISKSHRIVYLKECLHSLVNQTVRIPIYMSISFENEEIKTECITLFKTTPDIKNCGFLNILLQTEKTPQMMHYKHLTDTFASLHKWVMFCDDDDTYEPNRTTHIAQIMTTADKQIKQYPQLQNGGVYESTFGKTHREHRHEYWCYCINTDLMKTFIKTTAKYPDILRDKCCDVLLAEYLRRKLNTWIFIQLPVKYYNYRIEENNDSITGFIKLNQTKYTLQTHPPSDNGTDEWKSYLQEWNEYVGENMHVFLHDTYLRSIVGYDLQRILQAEFRNNYELTEHIDNQHIEKIDNFHKRVQQVANELYDIQLNITS